MIHVGGRRPSANASPIDNDFAVIFYKIVFQRHQKKIISFNLLLGYLINFTLPFRDLGFETVLLELQTQPLRSFTSLSLDSLHHKLAIKQDLFPGNLGGLIVSVCKLRSDIEKDLNRC